MQQPTKDLENIKSKLIEHIRKTYDQQKAETFISEINAMKENQFIDFLKKQGLLNENNESNQNPQGVQCIFCSIVFGDVPVTKIGENKKAIAILELNPISKGHSLIIPKEHIESKEKLPQESKILANQITEQLKKTFKPKKISLVIKKVMGHEIINLIPIYENETIDSPRQKRTPEELTRLRNQLEENKIKQQPQKTEIQKKEINSKNTWLPKRIP